MYEVFERLLKERNVTASDVSKATGIARSNFTDWKKGRTTPKLEKIQKIADYFDVSIEYLMTGEEKSPIVHADGQSDWYIDPATAKMAQEVFADPDTRMLFDAARDAKPEDIRLAAEMLKRMKETNRDG